jgi:hypothetical protein
MIKAVKHGTTAFVQKMRSSDADPTALDNKFETAVNQHASLRASVQLFLEDANAVLAALPRTVARACEFSALTERCYETLPPEDRGLSVQLARLTADLQLFVGERVPTGTQETVIKPLKAILTRIEALDQIRQEHKKSFLILEANKKKLEGYQKDPVKNAKKIQEYIDKINTRTADVEKMETDYRNGMDDLWTHRFESVGQPLTAMLNLILDIGRAVNVASGPIVQLLGEEAITKTYPSAPAKTSPSK